MTPRNSPSSTNTTIKLLAGASWSVMVHAALREFSPTGPLTLAVADGSQVCDGGLVSAVESALLGLDATVQIITPAARWGSVLRVRRADWIDLSLPATAQRLQTARMPDALARDRAIVLVNDLTAPRHGAVVLAIGAWSRFAHPRQRLGSALSSDRDGLAAEIAAAVSPALILIGSRWPGGDLLIASTDQTATEVTGRALGLLHAEPEDETIGAWEDPLVQRATEIGLGVVVPSQIEIAISWLGADSDRAGFVPFAVELSARMGVG